MPRKQLYPSRSIRVRAAIYVLIILAAVISLPPAFTRLTVLAQGSSGATAYETDDAQPRAEFVRQLSLTTNDIIYNPADGMLYASVPSRAGASGNSILPIVSPTVTPTPANIPTVVTKVDLPANNLVIDPVTETLYASVPSNAGATLGNSITSVDPKTGTIGASTFVGSEPGKLAISDDGQVIYVNLEGARAIRRFDTATRTPGVQFAAGVDRVADMQVVPGSQQSLAVSREMFFGAGVVVYDNGVKRPDASTNNGSVMGTIAFGATPWTLYGYNNHSTGFELVRFELDGSGVKPVRSMYNLISGFNHKIKFAGGRLYSTSGEVVDPEAEAGVGRFSRGGADMLVDTTLGRAFFISSDSSNQSGAVLTAYDINTFLPLGSVTLPGVFGTPTGLVRWGTDGLAFCMLSDSSTSPNEPNRVYLVQSALVSDGTPLPPTIQFGAANYNISESASLNTLITVTRTGGVTGVATVDYATGGGTATPGVDYTPASGTLTFAAGETTKTFTVSLIDDNVYEGERETIGLTLSGQTGNVVLGSRKTATLIIQDSKGRPSIMPVSMAVPEGDFGTTNAQFVVRLSHTSPEIISVNYATANDTATANSDYVATSGTLTFQPGELEKTIFLQIKGDTDDEGDERFFINFSNPINASVNAGNNVVTIMVDDRPFIQFGAANYNISESASLNTLITVTRTGGVTGVATVDYATGGGTATPGVDYTPASGTLTFAAGETTKTFTVSLIDDNVYEGERETIGLTLSGQTGNVVLGSRKTATLIIQDSKGLPIIHTSNLAVPEGDSGTTNAQFVVRLSHASTETVSVNYATANDTATANSDYVATSGTLTFQPGELEKTIFLQIKGDTDDEGDERFSINFSNPVNAAIFTSGVLTIVGGDDRPFIEFGAATFTVSEGDGRATITIRRLGTTIAQASISYFTLDDTRDIRCDDNSGSGGAAFARCDYATTYDTLVFAPGEREKTFAIPLVDDGHVEPVELVNLRLTSPVGALYGARMSAVLHIQDNDTANAPNPVDEHAFFVRQHYLDFLSREPDADGLAAWTRVLAGCANAFNTDANSPAALCDRNVVSSSFFRSAEFELKGYFVYRFYRVAFDRRPSYAEFVTDMRRVTGQTAEEVYGNRRAFSEAWVQREEFTRYLGFISHPEIVDLLLGRYGLTAINTADPANFDGDALVRLTRDELVAALNARRMTRAQVLRAIVQSREVDAAEYNGAFVAMQYYGYLRRAPEQSGYDAWLRVINRGDGYRVMVNGFMNSIEYKLRFGRL